MIFDDDDHSIMILGFTDRVSCVWAGGIGHFFSILGEFLCLEGLLGFLHGRLSLSLCLTSPPFLFMLQMGQDTETFVATIPPF